MTHPEGSHGQNVLDDLEALSNEVAENVITVIQSYWPRIDKHSFGVNQGVEMPDNQQERAIGRPLRRGAILAPGEAMLADSSSSVLGLIISKVVENRDGEAVISRYSARTRRRLKKSGIEIMPALSPNRSSSS